MDSEKIKLGILIRDWLENTFGEKFYIQLEGRFTGIHGIHCICHQSSRALSVVMDDELEVRIFPYESFEDRSDRATWIYLYPCDPEFFDKFAENLNSAHSGRYDAKTK